MTDPRLTTAAEFAAHYTALNLALVPIPSGRKAPTGDQWQLPKNAITNEVAALKRWGGAPLNMGLLHSVSHTATLDIDSEAWARVALESIGIDLDALLKANPYRIRGARGEKPVYRVPEGIELTRHALSWPPHPDAEPDPRTGKPKPFTVFELRSGSTQDVLPPSIHPDTLEPYTWVNGAPATREAIPFVPDELLDLWQNWPRIEPLLKAACEWNPAPLPQSKPRTVPESVSNEQKPDVIGAFNDRYGIKEILERNNYTKRSETRYLAPSSSSGLAGVHILPGRDGAHAVAYSHHGSDPLSGQYPHDAFGTYTILEQGGNVSDAVKAAAHLLGMEYSTDGTVTRGGNKSVDIALEWGARQPLPERPSVSTMPPEMIPEPLRAWLDDAARLACQPLEILAVNAICAASGAIGAAVSIHARATFYSTPNLWGAGVMPSGSMKTFALNASTEPLRKLEEAAAVDASEAQEDHALEVSRAEAKHAALEKSYTTGKAPRGGAVATADEVKEARRELTRLEQSRSEERTYTTANTTYEALGMLLKVNPKSVTVVRDELGPFIASMNREDMGEARSFFNGAWNGSESYSFHRVTREKVLLKRVCVAICGMIQPKLLDELMARMHGDPMQGDGFLQRFQVLVYPDAYPQWTPPEQQHPATPDALERAVRVFTALDQLEVREGESVKPRRLSFAANAQPVFNEWHDEIEVRSRPGGALAADTAFKSWFMKTKSLCVNLAAIFHLIELSERGTWGDQLEPISLDALNLALDWCDYLTTHAQKVYALELHPEAHAARVVAALIEDRQIKPGMTLRDVKRSNRSTPTALLEAGLYELERLGWVRLEEVDTGGRPSEVLYLHPELVEVTR